MRADQDSDTLEQVLHEILDLATDLEDSYRITDTTTRRLLNQGFFDEFQVDAKEVEPVLDSGFKEVTAHDTPRRLRAEARRRVSFGPGSKETLLAEREGFEPSRQVVPTHAISSRAP
jgi:hypothetical protein